ncbi:hypothetical protein [Halopiger djelfimassiliensis]|uniref:hypothetical protein n=1 Tax=Halopiger djelfimassiliensis TaxID=1293047 RepID=UPI0006777358|nr:hypothetical protein [Halopiger djelfimassiliensis]
MALSRRRLLGVLGGTGIAAGTGVACAASNGTPIVMLNNKTDRERTVTVTLVGTDSGTVHVDETVRIDVDDSRAVSDFDIDEPVTATVTTDHGLERSFRWDRVDPGYALSVDIQPDEIGFAVARVP